MVPAEFLLAGRGFLGIVPATEAQRRSAALMARTGVENALDDYWSNRKVDVQWCSRKTQLLCLAELGSPELAQSVEVAWRTLSDLCHFRPYQITPLETEVANAIALADRAVASLSAE